MALSLLISAWLFGTLGGVHCLAMCGGFVAAASARDGAKAGAPLLPASLIIRRQLAYHAGRVFCYAALGAAFGAAGAAALDAALLQPLQRIGVVGRIALGLAWGLVPCALVYAVLPLALFAGGAWQGALVMLAFGAGTTPTLLAASFTLRLPRRALGQRGWRYVAATAVIVFATTGIYRSLFVAGALAQGPFCLVGGL